MFSYPIICMPEMDEDRKRILEILHAPLIANYQEPDVYVKTGDTYIRMPGKMPEPKRVIWD
jgi:hypothetical protein